MLTVRKGDYISTYTGRKFWPLDPKPEDIFIEDIAHALALMNRYNGHTIWPYSVAQHSVLVASKCSRKNRLWGLLHDVSEYVISDVNSNLKRSKEYSAYRKIEKKIQKAVCRRFGLPLEQPEEVHIVDKRMLFTEARVLMKDFHEWNITHKPYKNVVIARWTPERAEEEFLKLFYKLGGKYVEEGLAA